MKLTEAYPTRISVSTALGFDVPEAFVEFVAILYAQSGTLKAKWPDLFRVFTGLDMAGAEARYPQTPPELFPFGQLGVDGVHYGYVIHAQELSSPDYPIGEICPMDFDGVGLIGSNTREALENLSSLQLEFGVGETERLAIAEISRRLDLYPSAEKARRLYDAEGNYLPIQPRVPPGWRYVPSADGIGVLAPKEAFGPGALTQVDPSTASSMYLRQADQAHEDGFFADALYYLREAYWHDWTDREELAGEIDTRLVRTYEALARPTLAEVVERRARDRQH